MPYDVKASRVFPRPAAEVTAAAAETLRAIDGKLGKGADPARDRLETTFNKTVASKAFGNRVHIVVQVTEQGAGCGLALEAFPVDPLGRKLRFGVLGDPARLVADAFAAHLDGRLKG